MKHSNKENDFSFEKQYCLDNPEAFIHEALGLKYSAEVLYEYENLKTRHSFGEETGITIFSLDLVTKGYFPYRLIRMLFSYSLENILKCIIVKNYKEINPLETEFPIKEIDDHDLKRLYSKAKEEIPHKFGLYLDSWTKCSVWAGRYPLPKNPNQMYQSRKSNVAQDGKSVDVIRISFGNLNRVVEKDILHTNISSHEYDTYVELFERLYERAVSMNK